MSNWTYEIDDGLVTFYEDGIQANIDKVFDALNAADARVSELKQFVDQLIEAGNAVVNAYPTWVREEDKWDDLVKDWKEG